MKTYIKFLINGFIKSFINIFFIMFGLVFILNILKEIEFFNNTNVSSLYPIYLSLLNSPSIIFEMFPFIFLISTQFFFIKLFNNNEINIFKYSGLENIQIIKILCVVSFALSIIIISLFYNISSNLQSYYLQIKNQYSQDNKYLAVINNNGLWIKDVVNDKVNIVNSSKVDNNFLINTFISTFNKDFDLVRSIKSNKIDIKDNQWLIYNATIYEKNLSIKKELITFNSNFNQKRIESLFSNLSSLSFLELINLRKNYKTLNYSIIDVDLQIYKIGLYPFLLVLMTILSGIIMFNTKKFPSTTLKIIIGLFFSVTIYYINNFVYVLGSTEKIHLITSVLTPVIFLSIMNILMIRKINDK